jgi:CHAT domain-containing protein/cytochrome c-type biogenesis protein CcmH/NrfG
LENGHLSIEELEELSQQKGPAENQAHVQVCLQCKSLLADCQELSARLSQLTAVRMGGNNGMNCPEERVWLDVAGGTLSSEETAKFVQHAADCPSCGPKLRAATQLFQDELTPEEENALATLPSASAQAQRELAEKLADTPDRQPQPIVIKPKGPFWRPLYITFVTAAVLLLATFLSLGPITDTLLAHGYKERGTLELRIAKADPPKEGIRGTTLEEREQPASLVLADLLIRSRLAFNPKNAHWLGEKGRLELIEGKPSVALQTLQQAHILDPKSKVITVDLASAMITHYSGHQDQPDELLKAMDELFKVLPPADNTNLQRDPNNLMAIYNLAIAYEIMGSFPQAIQEWELYLRLDSNSPWAAQARSRLESLRKQKHGRAPPAPNASLSDWLTYLDSGEPNASEASLDTAISDWFPNRTVSNAQLDKFLFNLSAKLEREHGDKWLAAEIRTPPTSKSQIAFKGLDEAIRLNARGDFEEAIAAGRAAEREFLNAHNFPGLARAQLEQVYSYQRATTAEDCLRLAGKLERTLAWKSFLWIKTQLLLDKASCLNQLGRSQEASVESKYGIELAQKSNYKIALLRAKGVAASQATARGDHAFALNLDVVGLREYRSDWYPPERAFQFYSDITFNSESAGLWHVTYDIGEEIIRTISPSPHKELEAVARYRQAAAAMMLNEKDLVSRQTREADRLFSALPENTITLTYRANGIVGLAKAEFESGDEHDALVLLQQSAAASTPSASHLFARRFFQLAGDIALREGRLSEAEIAYADAVEIAELTLQGLRYPRDRVIWIQENTSSYKRLAEVRLQQNNPIGGFEAWELFKAAMLRQKEVISSKAGHQAYAAELHPAHIQVAQEIRNELNDILTSEVLVSFVVLPSGLTAWIMDTNGLTSTVLASSTASFLKRAQEFRAECRDKSSDLGYLRIHAREMYRTLIAPIKEHLRGAKTLVIETDAEMDGFPFEALITDSDRYLVEELAIVYSPGVLFRKRVRTVRPINKSDRVLIVASPTVNSRYRDFLPPLPSVAKEAEFVGARFVNPVVLTGKAAFYTPLREQLREAQVFHFAGHAIQTNTGAALVLSTTDPILHTDIVTVADFPAEYLSNLQLVVLSACATDAASKSGFERLVDPFLQAGVPQIIATRWEVSSATNAILIDHLYHALLTGKLTHDALRESVLYLERQPDTEHPYYWAAPIFIGLH